MGHETPEFTDKANCGGVGKLLTIPALAILELKVGTDVLFEREFVEFESLDVGVKWGFGDQVGEQPFDCFKSQQFTRPFGPKTRIFFKNTKGTVVTVAIAEVG